MPLARGDLSHYAHAWKKICHERTDLSWIGCAQLDGPLTFPLCILCESDLSGSILLPPVRMSCTMLGSSSIYLCALKIATMSAFKQWALLLWLLFSLNLKPGSLRYLCIHGRWMCNSTHSQKVLNLVLMGSHAPELEPKECTCSPAQRNVKAVSSWDVQSFSLDKFLTFSS